jgi:hypothetical protein
MTHTVLRNFTDHYRFVAAYIEQRLLAIIEETEGRVPSNDEIFRHGLRKHFPTHQTIEWRGKEILRIEFDEYEWRVIG